MAEAVLPIDVLAQPKSWFRERYLSEQDAHRDRSNRFIQAATNHEFKHPTIEIPNEWKKQGRYIRVILTTVPHEQAPETCIHPYLIDTTDADVIKDPPRNTIYFSISDEDFNNGWKSFRISVEKLTQHELKNCGKLSLVNGDQKDIQRVNDPNDARKLIEIYQLKKSRLLFSLAEIHNNGAQPVIFDLTSVYSDPMVATKTTTPSNNDESSIRCAPQKGDWQGNDEVLMIIPKIDRRRQYQVRFDHPSMTQIDQIRKESVDRKTISITTPPCPIPTTGNQTIEIPIVVTQSGEEIARVNFTYQSCESCLTRRAVALLDSLDTSHVYEQSSTSDVFFDETEDHIFNDDTD